MNSDSKMLSPESWAKLSLDAKRRLLPLIEARAEKAEQRRIAEERERVAQNAAQIRARCRTLAGFMREAWPILEPETPLRWGFHMTAMCEHLEAACDGYINRLLINVPPGSSKSLTASVMLQAWLWGPRGRPGVRFLTTAFNDGPVKRDTRKTRDLVMSEWYQALWPHVVLTRTGETSFANSETGTREGVAFGSLTSQRGDFVILDDPHSTETAESDLERARTTRKFREGLVNRLNDQERSVIIVIMQRLHEDDVAGTILKLGMDYVHLMIPMEYEPERHCTTEIGWEDPRTDDGDLLDPVRFPRKAVEDLKRDMGAHAYCTPAEAPILMDDLSMKPIGQVQVGDKVIGFTTDTTPQIEGERSSKRRLVRAEVKSISRSVRPVVRITLDSGRVIRCTADHKWFTGRGKDGQRQRPLYAPAAVGSRLLRVCNPEIEQPTHSEDLRAAGWLAGFFDGEGSAVLMKKHGHYQPSCLVSFSQGAGQNRPICDLLERELKRFDFDYGVQVRRHADPEGRRKNQTVHWYYLRGNDLPMYQKLLHVIRVSKWRERMVQGALGTAFVIGREKVVSIEPDGVEEVFGLETTTGNYVVWGLASSNSGQYQQRPAPRGGVIFQRHWFRFEAVAPAGGREVIAWDLAATVPKPGKRPDWTVGIRGKRIAGVFYVYLPIRFQGSPGTVEQAVLRAAPKRGVTRIPQDPGQAGKAQVATYAKLLAGYTMKARPVTGDKGQRASPAATQAEAGNIVLVGEPHQWETFLAEVCTFPSGTHDDQVDAFADLINELALGSAYSLENL